MPENITPSQPPLSVKLAFVIDNQVADILHTDERLGAIFLSEPLIIDISDKIDENGIVQVQVNASYNPETQQFTNPS